MYKLERFEMSTPSILPRTTLSGTIKSFTAVPSAKNSGLLATVYLFLFYSVEVALIIPFTILDVPIGTVDFYTKMT